MTISAAAELKDQNQNEIIFLLDVSNSMNTTDKEYQVVDSIKQMISILPSNYSVGLVTYGSAVQDVLGIDSKRNTIIESLDQVKYSGYTDAGSGLEKAIGLFSSDESSKKTIILMSDGEILTETEEGTVESLHNFNRAVELAKEKNITIYTLALKNSNTSYKEDIYNSQAKLGQIIYDQVTADSTPEVLSKIAFEELGIVKCSVGVADSKSGTIHVKLPIPDIETAKILLQSTAPITNLAANYNSQEGKIITGKRFTTIEIKKPEQQEIEIHFNAKNDEKVSVDLIQEVKADFITAVSYLYSNKNMVEVKITPVSTKNESILLLQQPYFENKKIHILVDGEPIYATIKNGAIIFELDKANKENVIVKIDFKELNANLLGKQALNVNFKHANFQPLIITIILMLALVVIYLVKQRNSKDVESLIKLKPVFDFAGKLNVYITKAPDDSDIAPQVYNLYRLYSKKEIKLAEILEKCGIKLIFEGADKIIFRPGKNNSLVMLNQSNCTALKNRELMIKNKSYLIFFEEKITINFEDEKSELVFHYKNVKQSEKK